MQFSVKKYVLLRKSYSIRRLYDIVYHSPYVIILHMDNIKNELIGEVRKCLKKINVNSFLLNKDDFLALKLSFVAQGPSLIFYSQNYFYDNLFLQFSKNKLSFDPVYNKNFYPLSQIFFNQIVNKYKNSLDNINTSLLFLLNSVKYLFFFYKYLLNFFFFFYIEIF
jgi:hypothetical protein